MQRVILIGAGLLLWLLAQFIALCLAGAGHGWAAPLFASVLLAVLFPLALTQPWTSRISSPWLCGPLLIVAVATDIYLLNNALVFEHQYFLKVVESGGALVAAWIILWVAPQLLLVTALARSWLSRL